MYLNKKIGVVLPAGGVGKRFGADKPKQLLLIDGVEIYRHCVNTFLGHDAIDEIVFVCPREYHDQFADEFAQVKNVTVVSGGEHRWQSVRNGIQALSSDVEFVLAHDVARPFVSHDIISETIQTVISKGPCIVAQPVTDTVKVVRDSIIQETIDRETVYLAQTPQAFSVELINKAYETVEADPRFIPTDEASILERCKEKVYIVTGDHWNNKITTHHDLNQFEQMIQARNG